MIIVSKKVISLKIHFHTSIPVGTALKGKKKYVIRLTVTGVQYMMRVN